MNSTWTINDFEIYEQLGRGKLGVFYRALEKRSSVVVTLKMIEKRYMGNSNMRRRLIW